MDCRVKPGNDSLRIAPTRWRSMAASGSTFIKQRAYSQTRLRDLAA
jgi:hypothetical protein